MTKYEKKHDEAHDEHTKKPATGHGGHGGHAHGEEGEDHGHDESKHHDGEHGE